MGFRKKAVQPVVLTTEEFTGDTLVVGQAFSIPAPDVVLTVDTSAAPEIPPVEPPAVEGVAVEEPKAVEEAVESEPAEMPAVVPAPVEEVAAEPEAANGAAPTVVALAGLRSVRKTIDTLVFGCDSQRSRQDAAASAIEILDKLIGE